MGHEVGRVELGERDYEILSAIERYGILGLAQLEGLLFKKEAFWDERINLFFNEADRGIYTRACYKRLSDLEAAGYVRSQFYLNHRKLYTLAANGHEALILAGKAKLPGYRRGMSAALITHEIAASGVGFVLSALHGLKVVTERQMEAHLYKKDTRKGKEQIPDLWVVDQEAPKVIEVELVQKSEHRYKEIFSRYLAMFPARVGVFYITGWPKGPELIRKLALKNRATWVYAASLERFKASQGRCGFEGYRSIGMEDYDTDYLVPPDAPTLEPAPKASNPAPRVQEPAPKVTPAAPTEETAEEPVQWGGGPKVNPYAHLPPYQRPPEYRY